MENVVVDAAGAAAAVLLVAEGKIYKSLRKIEHTSPEIMIRLYYSELYDNLGSYGILYELS